MQYRKWILIPLITLVLTFTVAACDGVDKAEWLLTSLNRVEREGGYDIDISFHSGNFGGFAGCNYYGAEYTLNGEDFKVIDGMMDKTDFECEAEESVLRLEAEFLEAILKVTSMRVRGGSMEMRDEGGEIVLTFIKKEPAAIDPELEGGGWVLTSWEGRSLLDGVRITLNFAEGRFSGFSGCNSYGGELIAANEGLLEIEAIEMTMNTEALNIAQAYRVEGDHLEIDDSNGRTVLVFTRKVEYQMNPADLEGTKWKLVTMNGFSPIEDTTITITFDSGIFGGSAGCRDYTGTYETGEEDINFLTIEMIDTDCNYAEDLMTQEGEYTSMFSWVSGFRIGDNHLEIFTERGGVLDYVSLEEVSETEYLGKTWTLTMMVFKDVALPVVPGTKVTLTFENGALSGSSGCNTYQGGYTLEGVSISIGPIAMTEMACLTPEGAMDQEYNYLSYLQDTIEMDVDGNTLRLMPGDGRELFFEIQE
jgi:heat shock protein HslJ